MSEQLKQELEADTDRLETEAAAKKHGRRNSDNGHWIYPGTVLTLP